MKKLISNTGNQLKNKKVSPPKRNNLTEHNLETQNPLQKNSLKTTTPPVSSGIEDFTKNAAKKDIKALKQYNNNNKNNNNNDDGFDS